MNIDPHIAQDIADLGTRLSEAVIRNTAGAIGDRIKAIKTKRDQKEIIQELQEIIFDLIDDKNELRQIAEAYKEKFVAQQISQEDIKYITDNLIPVLKELITQADSDASNVAATASMKQGLDVLELLLSVRMLTVLQLVGFSFKQAIGEPLTLLLRQFINSKAPVNPQSNAEQATLVSAFNLEMARVVQDKDATERWLQLNGRSNL